MKTNLLAVICFLLIGTFHNASAGEIYVEMDSFQCKESSISDFSSGDISCDTRDGIGIVLDMSTLVFQSVAVICGVAPEPLLTKGTAAVSGMLGVFTGVISLTVKNMPCHQSGKTELQGQQKEDFIRAVCEATGKQFNPLSNTCER